MHSSSATSTLTDRLALHSSSVVYVVAYVCYNDKVHFNVFSAPKPGQSWGAFTTDTELPSELGGPSYHEEIPGNSMASSQSANKISISGAPSATVLVARLRFKPDVSDPTSL